MKAQILYLALLALEFGHTIAKHGQPKGNYNAGLYFLDGLFVLSILYWGGFFDCFLR
jgi:hypothetical protein